MLTIVRFLEIREVRTTSLGEMEEVRGCEPYHPHA